MGDTTGNHQAAQKKLIIPIAPTISEPKAQTQSRSYQRGCGDRACQTANSPAPKTAQSKIHNAFCGQAIA
jgi:hypothetical protein